MGLAFKRKVLLVNRRLQLKVVGYAMFSAISSALYFSSMQEVMLNPERPEMRLNILPWAIFIGVGILMFALIVALGLVISNQIAGPLFRMQKNLRALANGEPMQLIHLRPGDAYPELFEEYNSAVKRLKGEVDEAPRK